MQQVPPAPAAVCQENLSFILPENGENRIFAAITFKGMNGNNPGVLFSFLSPVIYPKEEYIMNSCRIGQVSPVRLSVSSRSVLCEQISF